MIAHWDIIQGSLAWHKIRYGKIGGTSSKGLFVDSDTLLDEIISAMLEPFELEDTGYASDAMERGNELEPLARLRLSEYAGIQFDECGWLQCDDNELLGISPDGINNTLTIDCEIKCPSRKKHTQTLRGGIIPLEHNHQIVHSFTVNQNLDRKYFASFRPECKHSLFVKMVSRHDLLNLGTKAKPVSKTIDEWARIARFNADELLKNALLEVEKLSF